MMTNQQQSMTPTEPMYGQPPNPQPQEMLGDSPDHTGVIKKGYDDTNKARIALVEGWNDKIKNAKKFFERNFKQMQKDMDFVSGFQWEDRVGDSDKYTANITQRHVAQLTAVLYAKNPTVVVTRREKLEFKVWDESRAALTQLMATMQEIQSGMQPQNPQQMQVMQQGAALYQDVIQGVQQRQLLDKIARTMEVLFKYILSHQTPNFKLGMKQLVRRVCVTGVGYIKLGFQRILEQRPEDADKVTDITQRIDDMQRIIDEMHECGLNCSEYEAESEKLRLEMQATSQAQDVVVEEGIVFDFPKATAIIIDPKCTNIRTFSGASWIAHEHILSGDDIKEIFKVDVGDKFMSYTPSDSSKNGGPTAELGQDDKKKDKMLVWEIYDKKSRLVYTVCDGYPDFLKEPVEPEVKLDRFWPIFPVLFNEVENENEIYPQSDVSLIRPMQREYNRARQGLREHRHANRPKMAYAKGALSPEDVKNFENHPANACIPVEGLGDGKKIGDVIQIMQGPPIQQEMYETQSMLSDIMYVAGAQEANLGGTGGGDTTATESSIAETSRISALQSNIDDMDDSFNELVNSMGQVMLMELSLETVQKICGVGAVWPVLTAQQVADQLNFKIEAGSSGRPNSALEISNFQKLAPFLLQIPGVSPDWMAKQICQRLNDDLDITEVMTDSMQSIVAMNSMQQASTGNPATDPNQQGQQHGGKPPIMGGRPMNPNSPPPEAPNGVPGPQHIPHPTPSTVPQMPAGQ